MNSRHLVRLFFSTLLLGGLSAGIIGFIARWDSFKLLFTSVAVGEILMTFFWLAGVGLIFSVISQMGFFAYLTVHRFGLGIFRSLWSPMQVVLILFVLFDLVYLRFISFGEGQSVISYVWIAALLLAVGAVVAYLKMKATNRQAFIPALFFMTVVTTVEWMPVLLVNDEGWLYFMLIPLLICNAYQLLILHRINQKSTEELARKKAHNRPKVKSALKNA
ncbi:MAG: KinB-signaling pathway activation protein [Bacillus sp. (in: firmicutes)]